MTFVSLIIPAYNEVAQIGSTVCEAIEYFERHGIKCEIIVAADGSDGTREAVRELASSRFAAGPTIRVIGSNERRGKGRAVREGVHLAAGDVIGFVDADNKTPISEFEKIAPFLRNGQDVVIGSRALRDSRIERPQPLHRRLGSKGFGIFMHTCVGLHDIIDTQCGFKFFQGAVARDLFQQQQIDGYMFDVEILFIARLRGYSITQVPVRWRDDGDSRLQLVVGNLRNVRDILSIRWRHRSRRPESVADSQPAPPFDT
jgi:dolichyl-phosphate beta-glucosyltransferase